ncbi:hypothetical protein [Streptomyces sp. CA-253872]|uniref:hypothetical protein n=1 Tax=Streptomyces sp. CA-253872 TaxID=3240067 RepID=UPI003D8DDA52
MSGATVPEVLAAIATHFADTHPGRPLTRVALVGAVASESYLARNRSTSGGGGAEFSRAVQDALPPADYALTRGQYAALVRERVASYEWTEDDNKPVIPRIPGMRPAPDTGETAKPSVPGQRPATGEDAA